MDLFNFKPQYRPLAGNNSPRPGALSCLRQYSLASYIFLLAIIAVSAGIGALIGRSSLGSGSCGRYSNPEIPLGTVREIFTYNRTFGDDPRMDHGTLAAWDSLVPNNQLAKAQYVIPQGARRSIPCLPCTNYIAWYVRMPLALKLTRKNEDAENILTEDAGQKWSIHQSYYGALQSRRRGEAHHHDHSGPHMRHCFDYLRQGLMCAADSTLEPVDTRLGGVTGWGDERVCRDYAALKDWAEKRRVSNSKGFSD